MTDVFTHIVALKVTCFCRLFNNNTGKNCFSAWYFSKFGFTISDAIFNGDFSFKQYSNKIDNVFWKDVFNSFYYYIANYNFSFKGD